MNNPYTLAAHAACALACLAALGQAQAQAQVQTQDQVQTQAPAQALAQDAPLTTLQTVTVTAKRERRVSKGATNLPLEIKDTPQSISTIDQATLRNFGASGSNDALRFATGLVVDEWETNRTSFQARGFDVMLTQIDGLGMANDWGLVEGQKDAYLFERIEVIRGANGLLTGVGNASGTINFVRKRPTNQNGGEVITTAGSYNLQRLALDYNQVLTEDGSWAGRLVLAHEDRNAHLRALHNQRNTLYGVVEGQIGSHGALTLGLTYQDARQRSPMWGSLTLPYADGTLADFDVSASTAQDWTRWNNRSVDAFVEYAHTLSSDWEGKLTYSHREGKDSTQLLYAYSPTGTLNNDNTGLYGWPYRSQGDTRADVIDANLSGRFKALGRWHEATIGLSHARQKSYTLTDDATGAIGLALPAFPYAGNVYAQPQWGASSVGADGHQQITRLYAAVRLALTERLKGIAGINAISLQRDGTSIYGGGVALTDETTRKLSPYLGLTYDITPDLLAYASYSDIFQAQDQRDIHGAFLAPMKGVNAEVGVKAEWLGRKLLGTVAVFGAEQKGLATIAGFDPVAQQNWYEAKNVKSRGVEAELTGRLDADTRLTLGYTQLRLTGPDGNALYEWVPRKTLKLLAESRLPSWPHLRLGATTRWQSDSHKVGGARQDAYLVANAFAACELSPTATVRLNVDSLFDKKYLRTVQFGAIYGAPRTVSLSLEYTL